MITTSIFELFKIGPGPSSSHTVGPMLASLDFRDRVIARIGNNAIGPFYKIRIELFGALAATGKGHGTDRAIVAGLEGEHPETVDISKLNTVFQSADCMKFRMPMGNHEIIFHEEDIFWNYDENPYWHPNTIKFVLLQEHQEVFSETYFSVGGGFIHREGETVPKGEEKSVPHAYTNMAELLALMQKKGKTLEEVLLENEMSLSKISKVEIAEKLQHIMQIMAESVQRGLKKEGILPGGLNVQRRAKNMYQKAISMESKGQPGNALFARLNAYALATSEENAAGQMVVTAPTNGAAGVIPACLEYLRNECGIAEEKLQIGLFISGMIGFIIKERASISGAELGCQAEVGSASSMAAALFSYCFDEDMTVIVESAEIALEHHLGMTCDPIKGLVQVPCIERNANGAVKAYNAYLLALGAAEKPIISFDQVVEVMRQTGEDLSIKYKETAMGGLAKSFGWGNMPGS